jgi:hypothetical protein
MVFCDRIGDGKTKFCSLGLQCQIPLFLLCEKTLYRCVNNELDWKEQTPMP